MVNISYTNSYTRLGKMQKPSRNERVLNLKHGADDGNRTYDLLFTKQLLYH